MITSCDLFYLLDFYEKKIQFNLFAIIAQLFLLGTPGIIMSTYNGFGSYRSRLRTALFPIFLEVVLINCTPIFI